MNLIDLLMSTVFASLKSIAPSVACVTVSVILLTFLGLAVLVKIVGLSFPGSRFFRWNFKVSSLLERSTRALPNWLWVGIVFVLPLVLVYLFGWWGLPISLLIAFPALARALRIG